MTASIVSLFGKIPDPRRNCGRRHALSDMVVIAILGVLCGADGWVQVAQFGRAKRSWLNTFLDLPHGIPSHDTFGKVFALIRPEAFEECFKAWAAAVSKEIHGVLAIDGKTLRRSFDTAVGKSALHMVSAWAADNGAVFGQLATEEKSNEITAIPKLLSLLDIKGLIVTIDAMGCQKQIAKQIVEQGGDYVLAVKDNQPTLRRDIEELFEWALRRDFVGLPSAKTEHTEKGHGRIETRRLWMTTELGLIQGRAAWHGLRCVAMIESCRTIAEKTTTERRYYISSLDTRNGQELARACRAHWGVENGLHWSLDVAFREDECRVRKGHGAENLSRLRRIGLTLLKQETTEKVGIKTKRLRAGWDHDYLLQILGGIE